VDSWRNVCDEDGRWSRDGFIIQGNKTYDDQSLMHACMNVYVRVSLYDVGTIHCGRCGVSSMNLGRYDVGIVD
jgi:hypothetical protein